MQDHKYSLAELEGMIPWEREVYVGMLIKKLQKDAEQQANNFES
jgi:hypothetical protein